MSGNIEMYGFEEFGAKLKALENLAESSEKALMSGAEIVKEKVKPKIPKSEISKEHAADHIEISKVKKSKGVPYVTVGPERGDNGPFFYLKFYEFGTHNPNALGKVIPAKHMFQSTCVEEKAAVKAAMVEVLKKEAGL